MTKSNESSSTQKRAKHRTTGAFRCLSCFKHLSPPKEATLYTCPKCDYEWRVAWFTPEEPRIRGPVWESYEKLNQAKMTEKGEK
jgi:hypothetical protein